MRLSDATLRGMTVIAADGQAVGEVGSLFLNSDTWSIESLQLKLRREIADRIGASRTILHAGELEVPIGVVQSVGDAVILSSTIDQLRNVLPARGESKASPAR
jgi:sporulation protein YlmC with PRC-barrel domain